MTKRLLSILVSCLLLFAIPVGVSAQSPDQTESNKVTVTEETVDLGDGLTVVTTIRVSQPVKAARSTSTTVSADKSSVGKVSGVEVWNYTISGDFTYNGSTAKASGPSDDYSIYASNWSCSSHSVRASGASIIGSASFTSNNGVRKSVSPKLTCSPSGDIR